MFAYFASASLTLLLLGGREVLRLHADGVVAEDEHLGVAEADGSITSRTSLTDAEPELTVNCHCVPPSKSMPRLRPRTANATTEIRISVPDRIAHRHERSMKLKCVRSW